MKIGFRCGRWPRPRAVPLAMEMDEAFNPIEVSLLGAEGILLDPNSVADAGRADAIWQADPLLPV